MLKQIAKEADRQGWEVKAVRPTLHADEFVVLVKRSHTAFPDRPYSTHKFSTTANAFYYGHYDMTEETATQSFQER